MPLGKPLLDILDGIGYGALLLDAFGEILRFNPTAARLLSQYQHQSDQNNDLVCSQRALAALLNSGGINRSTLNDDTWTPIQRTNSDAARPLILRSVRLRVSVSRQDRRVQTQGVMDGRRGPNGYRVDNRKLVIARGGGSNSQKNISALPRLAIHYKASSPTATGRVRTRTRVLASGRILGNVHLTNRRLATSFGTGCISCEINHRGKSFLAEHEPIIEKEVFEAVQNILNENPNRHDTGYNRSDALLVGLLFDVSEFQGLR